MSNQNPQDGYEKFLKKALRGLGRSLLGEQLDNILSILPREYQDKSIFTQEDAKKGEDLPQLLEDLNTRLDALIEQLKKFESPGFLGGITNPFAIPDEIFKNLPNLNQLQAAPDQKKPRFSKETQVAPPDDGSPGNSKLAKALTKLMGEGENDLSSVLDSFASKNTPTPSKVNAGTPPPSTGVDFGEGLGGEEFFAGIPLPSLSQLGIALGELTAGMVLAVEATILVIDSLREFSNEVISTNLKFADLSGAMAAVQAQFEVQQITLSQIHGQARAEPTLQLTQYAFETERAIAPVTDSWSNIKTDFLSSMHALAQEIGLASLSSIVADGLDSVRSSLRSISFWVDWDKKKREAENLGIDSQISASFLGNYAHRMAAWIRGGRIGPPPRP